MKPWLPHLRVLRPKGMRNRLVKEYKQWIQWQESNKVIRVNKKTRPFWGRGEWY